jgi:hypothetical protein
MLTSQLRALGPPSSDGGGGADGGGVSGIGSSGGDAASASAGALSAASGGGGGGGGGSGGTEWDSVAGGGDGNGGGGNMSVMPASHDRIFCVLKLWVEHRLADFMASPILLDGLKALMQTLQSRHDVYATRAANLLDTAVTTPSERRPQSGVSAATLFTSFTNVHTHDAICSYSDLIGFVVLRS